MVRLANAAVICIIGCNAAAGLDDLSFVDPGALGGGGGAGTSNGGAGAGGESQGGGGAEAPGCADPSKRTVFVTLASLPGNQLVSLFNQTCQEEAAAAGCGDKVFVAWTSSDEQPNWDAASLIPQGAWHRPDGAQIAASHADLVDGMLDAPMSLLADGSPAGEVTVWTGTLADGMDEGSDCHGWEDDEFTGIVGRAMATDAEWTNHMAADCDSMQRVYCFQSE